MRLPLVLAALCLTSALPAQRVDVGFALPVAQAIRAIPPDSAGAWCILADTLDEGAARYVILRMMPAAQAIAPACRGLGVVVVRPMCWIAAEEVQLLVNVAPMWTLLCGAPRPVGTLPPMSYIWRSR